MEALHSEAAEVKAMDVKAAEVKAADVEAVDSSVKESIDNDKREVPTKNGSPPVQRSPHPHPRSRSRSRSPSPKRSRRDDGRYRQDFARDTRRPAADLPFRDRDRERAAERARQMQRTKEPAVKPALDPEKEREILALTTRSGGAYIPPAKLRALQAQIRDTNGEAFQRMSWEALKKSINGLINKVNMSNIKNIVVELFGENLVRGRGLFARSILRAQQASPVFTPIYAALISIVNTKLPAIGSLILTRLILGFQRAYRRNDKTLCLATTKFLAHLVNQQVAHEIVALQILALLLERPTDDSVEVAVDFMREVGAFLSDVSPKATHASFERFRSILHEAQLDKRVQYMIEVLFQVRKDKFKDNPSRPEELDIVEEDDQITHLIALDDELTNEDQLDVFKFDSDFQEHEENYREIKREILGDSDEESDAGSNADGEESEEEEDDEEMDEEARRAKQLAAYQKQVDIQDMTDTNLINLRKMVYLTIMSSLDYEEACHKLMKLALKPGQERTLCSMIIECCGQERSYEKYYGLMGERFCKINRIWADCFSEEFVEKYTTIHRFETSRIRNTGKFFAHLFFTDALPWTLLEVVHLSEEETTSSSRIFLKVLLQEISESIGVKQLNERLKDPELAPFVKGLFPQEDPRNIRFAINYFTSIGLGLLTEEMREYLKNLPKLLLEQKRLRNERAGASESESDSDSLSGSESDDSSGSTGSDTSSSSYSSSVTSSKYSRRSSRRSRRSPERQKSLRAPSSDERRRGSRSRRESPPSRAASPRRRDYSPPSRRAERSPPRRRRYSSHSRSRSPTRVREDRRRSREESRSPSRRDDRHREEVRYRHGEDRDRRRYRSRSHSRDRGYDRGYDRSRK